MTAATIWISKKIEKLKKKLIKASLKRKSEKALKIRMKIIQEELKQRGER